MKLNKKKYTFKNDLPFVFKISFEKIFDVYEKYADEAFEGHMNHDLAKRMVSAVGQHPELIEGIEDLRWLDENRELTDLMLDPLFPEVLSKNEIKAAAIPFSFNQFRSSDRLQNILRNAGEKFELSFNEFDDDLLYINSCIMILAMVHGRFIDLKRPFFFHIPDKNGVVSNYRVAFNADMSSITATERSPKITDEDFRSLINSYDNVDVWKEKFPVGSYVFKGFGIMNMFDVSTDESISAIRTNLLKGDSENLIIDLQDSIRKFYKIDDLMLGFTMFDISEKQNELIRIKKSASIVFDGKEDLSGKDFFCDNVMNKVFKGISPLAISDVEQYAKRAESILFADMLLKKSIKSIILVPILAENGNDLAILEIASPRILELNSISLQKLKDIIPMFKYAVERASREMENKIEASIQQHYTAIHPAVKWRFIEAAQGYNIKKEVSENNVKIEEIVFKEVYPLFGQGDIKNSSLARNETIKEDLLTQLDLAKEILNAALATEKITIYEELIFRVNQFIANVENGLKAGHEVSILEFLKREIYPTFKHIGEINEQLSLLIAAYMDRLDPELKVIYEKRKDYERSVTYLNDQLAKCIDDSQKKVQSMFPHYFERYKTDGVEHNIYIGQSMVKNKSYDHIYLYNLRLWQLQTMYDMENVARAALQEMDHKLEIASMILVHSSPLDIRFRMDEKQFDVDGAYNIRYAIIKKRIDKAHIKGTDQRITIPGKLSIVYSQDSEGIEYMKYMKFLQSKNMFGEIEQLEVEDLQGVSGLKALRAELIYQSDFETKSSQAIGELIKEIQP